MNYTNKHAAHAHARNKHTARYAGLPVPLALCQLIGADGPVVGGWWTPAGLAGPGPMSDAAEARALAKTLNLRAAMGARDDGAGSPSRE